MIGRHTYYLNDINDLIGKIKKNKIKFIQFFLHLPEYYLINDDMKKLKKTLIKENVKSIIHGNYSINLAHKNITPKGKESLRKLKAELDCVAILSNSCLGLVIHVGKNVCNVSKNEALNNFSDNVNLILFSTNSSNTTLFIETGAGSGNEIGTSIEELARIYNKQKYKDRIKFCIDTCHIWAAGYNIGSKKGVNDYIKKFNDLIGIDKIGCIHFNDSKNDCGSRIDRHEDLGYGKIGISGLRTFLKFGIDNDIPIMLETPLEKVKNFNDEMKIIKNMLLLKKN